MFNEKAATRPGATHDQSSSFSLPPGRRQGVPAKAQRRKGRKGDRRKEPGDGKTGGNATVRERALGIDQ